MEPGGQVVVTITASDYGDFGGVAETLPTGFSYVGDTFTEGDVKVTGQNVRFVFQGTTVDPFTYTVTASSTPGTYTFRGSLRDEDRIDYAVGGDSSIRVQTSTDTITPPPSGGGGGGGSQTTNRAPRFDEGTRASRSVAENSPSGTDVGDRITARDRDGDNIVYRITSGDTDQFDIDEDTGQVTVAEDITLDFESKDFYSITVRATDPGDRRDEIRVNISLINVEEVGTVTLSSTEPEAGVELTATLTDPDGGITGASWQWQRSADGTTWADVDGATAPTYTPTEADAGMRLRVNVTYSDGAGSDITLEGPAVELPAAPTPTPTDTPTPTPTATPTPRPTATATPTPRPTATATPTPRPTATAMPQPTATAAPTATATPRPTATAMPQPTATAAPTATATPRPTATATPTATAVAPGEDGGGLNIWLIILIIVAVVAAAGGGAYFFIRQRQAR